MAEFNLHFGAASSQTEFHEGYGSFSYLAPGKYLLATLDVTVISGRPRLTPSASSQLAATFLTSFGSECDGREGDNSVALGRDWFDVDGVGTGSGGGWDDGPIPESITVGQGVVYFGGNRIPAPLTIGFEGADAVVNGARLPPLEQPPIPAGARTSSDALRFELDSTGTALTRDGVRKGLSRAELLQQLRTHYASSELVREVQVEGERLRVTYVDYPIQTIVYMPSRIPMTDPSPEERRRSDAVHAYALLRETKAILDQGAVVLITRDGWTTVPPLIARQVDDALQSLQAGAGVTTVRRELLDSTIPADVQAWVRQPARLDPVGGGDK